MAINGELKDLYTELDKRMAVTDAKTKMWRENHSSVGDVRHDENKKVLAEINATLKKLPCEKRTTTYNNLKYQQRLISGAMLLILGLVIWHLTGYTI